MRKCSFILLLFTAFHSHAQKVTIKGIAFDTTKGRNWVTVILNDTVSKFVLNTIPKVEEYSKLWDDSNYVVHAKANGQFEIKVTKGDSLFFKSWRHITKSFLVDDLLKQKKIDILLEPQVCEPYIVCHDSMPKRYVFVGEKIKVDYAEDKYYCNRRSMDSKFDAEYKILENIYGNFPKDTIQFEAFDHYGRPLFENYQYVMLFVSKYCNELIHQKYLFYNVYKTVDNKWAAPYQALDYLELDSSSTIKPVIIQFKEPIEIDISKDSKEGIAKLYPTPYYRIENGKAIAIYGNYANELMELKMQTDLKDWKIRLK